MKITATAARKIATANNKISYICETGAVVNGGYFEIMKVVEPIYYLLEKSHPALAEFAGLFMDAPEATGTQMEASLTELHGQLSCAIR